VPGVFAAGDVRLDSMKRVASAVGEGAMSTYLVSVPNIEVRYRSEVVAGRGDGHLEQLTLADQDSGVTEQVHLATV
jgi:hypothetical protein